MHAQFESAAPVNEGLMLWIVMLGLGIGCFALLWGFLEACDRV